MPLLHNGQITEEDRWSIISDDTALPDNADHTLVSLPRYLDVQANGGTGLPGGVLVAPDDEVLELAPFIDQLRLIGIDFPVFTDGRGYSHARLLRKRLNYAGELRAFGDVRADQILFMTRSGIDSFNFAEAPDEQLLQTSLSWYQKNYQPSYALPVVS